MEPLTLKVYVRLPAEFKNYENHSVAIALYDVQFGALLFSIYNTNRKLTKTLFSGIDTYTMFHNHCDFFLVFQIEENEIAFKIFNLFIFISF